jgi:hypothetical protein
VEASFHPGSDTADHLDIITGRSRLLADDGDT